MILNKSRSKDLNISLKKYSNMYYYCKICDRTLKKDNYLHEGTLVHMMHLAVKNGTIDQHMYLKCLAIDKGLIQPIHCRGRTICQSRNDDFRI